MRLQGRKQKADRGRPAQLFSESSASVQTVAAALPGSTCTLISRTERRRCRVSTQNTRICMAGFLDVYPAACAPIGATARSGNVQAGSLTVTHSDGPRAPDRLIHG